jgi:F0F1-type ATP synthase delta subunit
VRLENRIDKSIIGGAKIYVDGKLIDASVKSRLENMKQRIRI